ncbi:hypothetical protein ACHAXT_004089 [Thalassiosira profunda]
MSPNSSHHRLSIGSYGTDSSEHDALEEECDDGSDDDWGERSPALFPPLELFKRRIVYQPALVLIAIALLGFGWMKRDASAMHPDVAGRYTPTLIWSDEFDGDAVDLSKWTFVNGNGCDVGLCGWGNNELEWYTPSNARVSGGKLVFEARKYETPGGPPTYTSSKIISRGKADFGVVPSSVEGVVASLEVSRRFEARMKLPWGEGIWPAFWMLPTYDTYGGWPKSGEIDIMESIGKEGNTVHGTVHYGLDGPQHQYSEAGITLAEASGPVNETFHTYSVERLPGTIRWYLDDILYATVMKEEMAPYHWSLDEKFYFILNLAVGGNWPGNPVDDDSSDGQEATLFPQSFEVDYVRVYEGIFPRISGQSVVECSEENVRYEIVNIGAEEGDSYMWTVPENATIVTGQGTSRVTVNFHSIGARSEVIRVRANGNAQKASVHAQKLQTYGIGIRVIVTDFTAIVASAIFLSKEQNQSPSAECSASPAPMPSSDAEKGACACATPIQDIRAIYDIGDVIGEGAFGQVFYATRVKDGKAVALKCIPKEWTLHDEFQREIDVLHKLNNEDGGHPHCCRMYSIYEGDDTYWMSMELIEGGELFEHLIAEGAYSEAKASVFTRQLAEALAFMHKAGIVHGDLKPENLLLSSWDDEEADLKLVDFGCSVIVDRASADETPPHSTICYDPPEKIIGDLSPSYESDVWAAGCILYIILTGSHPFDKSGAGTDEETAELVKSIGTSEDRLSELAFDDRTEGLSPSVISLLRRMLHPDPKQRATSEQLRRNRWVQGLTASWEVLDGIDGRLEKYWQREFQRNIMKKFGGVSSDEQLRAVFTQIDEDGNGSIDLDELSKVLRESGAKPKDIKSIFDAVNVDHDKGVSFEEFRSVMQSELPAQHYQSKFRDLVTKEIQTGAGGEEGKMSEPFKAAARRLFNSMDLDGNGSLDCHELRLLLRKLGVDEAEISLLVASVDLDKDGSLTFDEFSKVMFGARSKTV